MWEAYKIAVKLQLVDSVTGALAGIATSFGALHKSHLQATASLAQYEASLKRIKSMALTGGALAGAGYFGLKALDVPLEEAKKYQLAVAQMWTNGLGDNVNRQAQKYAEAMRTFGTSTRDNLGLVADALAVFKNLDHAQMAAPIMARMKFANETLFGKEGGASNDRAFMQLLQVIEMRKGLSSDKEFETQANFVQQVITGIRGRVDPGQMLAALKTGGVGLSQRSNAAFYLGSEPMIQEFGGNRYGTAVMSIYQNLVNAAGKIPAQQELYRLGLLHKNMVEFNALGRLKRVRPGAFVGTDVFEKEGELAMLEKVLLPAFAKKGITSEEAIIRELAMIVSNRTGSSLLARTYQQRASLHTRIDANESAQNIDQAAATARGTLAGSEADLLAKWRDVMKELGITILPMATSAVRGLTSVLSLVADFAKDYPNLTQTVVVGGTILTIFGTMAGVALTAAAGLSAVNLALGATAAGAAGTGVAKGAALALGAGKVLGVAGLGLSAGYATGSLLWDHLLSGTQAGNFIGGLAAHSMASLGFKGALEAEDQETAWRRSGFGDNLKRSTDKVIKVESKLVVDGRVLAKVIDDQMTRQANGASYGTTQFDPNFAIPPVGMPFTK